MQLVSKISNLCDPDPPTSQTDGQTDRQTDRQIERRTTSNLNTALCTSASRGKPSSRGRNTISRCDFIFYSTTIDYADVKLFTNVHIPLGGPDRTLSETRDVWSGLAGSVRVRLEEFGSYSPLFLGCVECGRF